jgi:Zn-dependent protease
MWVMSESGTGGWRARPVPEPGPEPEYEPIQPGSGRSRGWRERARSLGGPVLALLVLLATKGKAILLLLPKLKIFTTSASMLVSIAAYALIWGWAFAVGFVLLLLVHELGHVIQLRREGVEASAPMFIPFLGAVIAAKSLGDDAAAEARVGLAGPILGSLGALVPLAIWQATGEEFWQALAYVGFFLNLLNLLPVLPLDGGRAMAALSPWVWVAGFAALVALTFTFPNPIMILILIFGGIETWRRFKTRNSPEGRAYHAVPGRTRALVAVTYLGLAAALAVGVSETFLERDFDDV